jgi:hypothetical protein
LQIPKILQVSWKNEDMNARPWSVINFEPESCRVIILVAYTLAHVSAVWSGIGMASTYLVK